MWAEQRRNWVRHLLDHWIVLRSARRHRRRLQQDLPGSQGEGATQPDLIVARTKVTSKSASDDAVGDDGEQPQQSAASHQSTTKHMRCSYVTGVVVLFAISAMTFSTQYTC